MIMASVRLLAVIVLAGLLGHGSVLGGERDFRGVWIAAERLFAEGAGPSVESRRKAAQAILDRCVAAGARAVFFEAYLRGYTTCRVPLDKDRLAPMARRFVPAHPEDPDVLDILIDEARPRGVEVHAWVHLLYFRSDNLARSRPDDGAPTLWDDLIAGGFRRAAARAPAGSEASSMSLLAARSFERGYEIRALKEDLLDEGQGMTHSPLESVVGALRDRGLAPPLAFTYDFLGRLHPPLSERTNGSVYLDPAHPHVRKRLVQLCEGLISAHPGLTGLHLDHVRYPEGAHGYTWEPVSGELLAPGPGVRRQAVNRLVSSIVDSVRDRVTLSAAVLPDVHGGRLWHEQKGTGQDWYRWGLDLYLPMLYGRTAKQVRKKLASYRRGLEAAGASSLPVLAPAVARLSIARQLPNWGFFEFGSLPD